MAHVEDISLTEWNDTADTIHDLEQDVRAYGAQHVADVLSVIALSSTTEVNHD